MHLSGDRVSMRVPHGGQSPIVQTQPRPPQRRCAEASSRESGLGRPNCGEAKCISANANRTQALQCAPLADNSNDRELGKRPPDQATFDLVVGVRIGTYQPSAFQRDQTRSNRRSATWRASSVTGPQPVARGTLAERLVRCGRRSQKEAVQESGVDQGTLARWKRGRGSRLVRCWCS